MNPINKKGKKFFQCTITIVLNYDEVGKSPERISQIKHFIDKHNWEGIKYLSEKDDCKKIEKNNSTIAQNVLNAILLTFQNITQMM